MSLNRVLIMGNLGKDPEIRYTQSQMAVVTLAVATTDYRTVDGQKQEQTEWHRIVVWGKQAENCAKYLTKGSSVLVEGKLQTRAWDDKNGQKRYTTEIVAFNVRFVGGKKGAAVEQEAAPELESPSASSGNYGGPETPSIDDIPF